MELEPLIFNSNKKFTQCGEEVKNNISRLYVKLYNIQINRHLGIPYVPLNLNKFLSPDYNQYAKFHLTPLLLDSNVNLDEILKFFNFKINNVASALQNFDSNNMWRASNIHMGALSLVKNLNLDILNNKAYKLIKKLDKTNFTSSSFKYSGSINRIAAFYHYIPYIDSMGIEISNNTLKILFNDLIKMQNELGSFCYPNGFSCIELDSVVTLAYLKKNGFNVDYLMENKLFNIQSLITDNGWELYGKGRGRIYDFLSLIMQGMSIQDFLWNFKKIFFDMQKTQFDNRNIELRSNANEVTLMSNYFALTTYKQIILSLEIENIKINQFESCGLSYVIK